MTQSENQDVVKSFFVRGYDILNSDFLPGMVLVLCQEKNSESYVDQLMVNVVKALHLPLRFSSLAITEDNWTRDVDFHSTKKSQPGTCARIPVLLSLGDIVSETDRYLIRSYEYDPLVHIGDGVTRTLSESLGLENKVHGLMISAHNKGRLYEIIEACKWIASESGKFHIARDNFLSRIEPATEKHHTRTDCKQFKWPNVIDMNVVYKGTPMRCVKQNGSRVSLLNSVTGQKIWRELEDLDDPKLYV